MIAKTCSKSTEMEKFIVAFSSSYGNTDQWKPTEGFCQAIH